MSNLPDGTTDRMIDEAAGSDEWECAFCGCAAHEDCLPNCECHFCEPESDPFWRKVDAEYADYKDTE